MYKNTVRGKNINCYSRQLCQSRKGSERSILRNSSILLLSFFNLRAK